MISREAEKQQRREERIAQEAQRQREAAPKLRLAVFLAEGGSWGDVDETAMEKGLGGRETALVNLSLEWASMGHEVYAFVPRENIRTLETEGAGFVKWIPFQHTLGVAPVLDLDAFISWENVEVFKQLGNANVGRRVVEMQVAHLYEPDAFEHVDKIAVLSPWAKRFLIPQLGYPIVPDIIVLPNGVDLSRFEGTQEKQKRGLNFIYSSSPDRGLHHLLDNWQRIRQAVEYEHNRPCTLHVCYGIESFIENNRWAHSESALRALSIERGIHQENVLYHGKVGQDELAEIQGHCDMMLYPCDPMSPTETGCISIVEAFAAEALVVTTDADCIKEDFGEIAVCVELPFDIDKYIEAIIDTLHFEDWQARVEAGEEFAETRSWSKIAADWIPALELTGGN